MLIMHPVYLIISLGTACVLCILVTNTTWWKSLMFYGGLFLSMAIVNPFISQEGKHVLLSIGSRVVTLEAIAYGLVIAMMLVAVLLWFSCYNEMMTSDKFLYVFGKLIPIFALTVVITLRLIPRFQQQLQRITIAQKAIGLDYQTGSIKHRITGIVRIISILLTWALENAVETADVMKARGYGLPNKSTFTIYSFQKRDYLFLSVFFGLLFFTMLGVLQGTAQFSFYPTMSTLSFSKVGLISSTCFLLLCSLPIGIEIKERWKWRY